MMYPSFFSSMLARRIISYTVIFLVVFIALNALGWFAFLTYKNHGVPTLSIAADPAGPLIEKVSYYKTHKDDYTALFLGDSRTLCGLHPDVIDPLWGRTSYNLSHWATWLPAQYALIADIVPTIPKNTVVVWSIGHKNFEPQTIRAVYPPGWARLPYLISLGYPAGELINAQLAFSPFTALIGRRLEFFTQVETIFAKPLSAPVNTASAATASSPAPIHRKGIAYVENWYDDKGRLVSEGLYKINGAMARREIIPSYYRAIQARKETENRTIEDLHYDPASIELFKKILILFKDAGITLVVNEMEEAPYTYLNETERRKYRQSFSQTIRPLVEEQGFAFISSENSILTDADYFDYNHLNEKGAVKYNRALAPKLKRAAP